ncbi:unnamed protein product [Oppiella nova]|uniref:Alcohol dehydrogenase-like C-terminal domain-containing protein n=1 Tax=Oppiella nova TaxID=334625 RepID=A0A7R9MCU3_9ACAR|nr:unnamed protein product [Oppiella nova]CAG2173987.1 unnamed protein product [Oppiella nova]
MGRIQKGDKVLITASAGGTGHIGIQWAKQKGAYVIGLTSSEDKAKLLKELGTDRVINYKTENLDEVLTKEFPGAYVIGLTSSEDKAKLLKELGTDRVINYKTENLDEVLTKEFPNGVDVVWETIGGQVFETLLNHLVPKGRLIIVGSISGYKSERITSPTIENLNFKVGSKTLSGFCLPDYKDLYAKYLKQLIGDVVNNKLRVVLDLGQNTSEGEFTGIDSVVRGVEDLTSSEDKAKLLKELGTDRVINYKTENLDEVLTKEFPNGVDVVWETIGGQVYETLFNHLAPKGRLIIVGSISGYKSEGITSPNIESLKLLRGSKTLSGFYLPDHKDLYAKYLKQLIGDVVNNKLRVVLDLGQNTSEGEFTGIDSVVRGVEHLHLGRNIGKK